MSESKRDIEAGPACAASLNDGAVARDARGGAPHGVLGDVRVGGHDAERGFDPHRAPLDDSSAAGSRPEHPGSQRGEAVNASPGSAKADSIPAAASDPVSDTLPRSTEPHGATCTCFAATGLP